MAYEIKVIPNLGAPVKKNFKSKIEVGDYISSCYKFNLWGDSFKCEVKKIGDLKALFK